MAKEFAKQFYNSSAWKSVRKAFIAYRISIDGGLCQRCIKKLGYIVDHKEELTPENITDPDIALNQDNFQYLCLECHNIKTFKAGEEDKYFFDEDGYIQELPPLENG